MAKDPFVRPEAEPAWPGLDRCAKILAGILIAYWGLFAALTPVTVWDSQTYNLARLPLAERYGLFGNPLWYSERQIAFPWSFDASEHSNRDGIRGAAANLIRYLFGIVNLGRTPPYGPPPYIPALERACRGVLRATGLVNVGYRPGYNDANLQIMRSGGETTSDYAAVGTCLVPLALWQLIRRPLDHPARWLAAAGFLYLGAIAFTVAWMPYNIRFLMPCFVLFALAVVVGGRDLLARSRLFRSGLLALAAYSAVVPTYYSFNKQPRDLIGGVTQREWETYLELLTMRPILRATKDWLSVHPRGRVLLLAGGNSWVLPFFTSGVTRVDPLMTPHLAPDQMPAPSRPVAILVLDRPDFNPDTAGAKLIRLQVFEEPGTSLFEVIPVPVR